MGYKENIVYAHFKGARYADSRSLLTRKMFTVVMFRALIILPLISRRMAAFVLYYHSIAPYTSICDLSARAVHHLWRLFIIDFYIGGPTFIGFSC